MSTMAHTGAQCAPTTLADILKSFSALCSFDHHLESHLDMEWARQMVTDGANLRQHHVDHVRGRDEERNKRFADIVKSPQRKVRSKPSPQRSQKKAQTPLFAQPRVSNKENDIFSPTADPPSPSPVRPAGTNTALQPRALNSIIEQPMFASPSSEKPTPKEQVKPPLRTVKPMPAKKTTRSVSKAAQQADASKASSSVPKAQPSSPPVTDDAASSAQHPPPQHSDAQEPDDPKRSTTSTSPVPAPTPEAVPTPDAKAQQLPDNGEASNSPAGEHPFGTEAKQSITVKPVPVDAQITEKQGQAKPDEMDVDDSVIAVDAPTASKPAKPEAGAAKREGSNSTAHKSFITAGSEAGDKPRPRISSPEKDELEEDDEEGDNGVQESRCTHEAVAANVEAPMAEPEEQDGPSLSDIDSEHDELAPEMPQAKRSLHPSNKDALTSKPAQDEPTARNLSKSFYQQLLSAASNDPVEQGAKSPGQATSADGKKRKSDEMESDSEVPRDLKDAFRPNKKVAADSAPQGTVGLGLAAQQPTNAVAALRSRLGAVSAKTGPASAQVEQLASPHSPRSPEAQSPAQPSVAKALPTSVPTPSKLPQPSPKLGEPVTTADALKPTSAPVPAASPSPAPAPAPKTQQAPPAPSTPQKTGSVNSQTSSIRSIFPSHNTTPKTTGTASSAKSKMSSLLPTPNHRSLRSRATPAPALASTTPQTSPKKMTFSRLPLAASSPKGGAPTPTRPEPQEPAAPASPSWNLGSKLKGLFSFAGGQHHGHGSTSQPRSPTRTTTQAAQEQVQRPAPVQAPSSAQPTRLHGTAQATATRKAAEAEDARRKAEDASKPAERAPSSASIRAPTSATAKKTVQPTSNPARVQQSPAPKPTITRPIAPNAAPTPARKPVPVKTAPTPTHTGAVPAKAAPTPSKPATAATTTKVSSTPAKAPPAPRPPPKNTVTAKPLPANQKNAGSAFRPQPNGRIVSGASATTNTSSLTKKPSMLTKPQSARPIGPSASIAPGPQPTVQSANANFSQYNPFQQAKPKQPPPRAPSAIQAQQIPGAFNSGDVSHADSTRDEDIDLPEVRSEYSMSDDEETIRRRQMAPDWCKGQTLQDTLAAQADVDTDALFGVPAGNVALEEIFPQSNARRRPRSSSANWTGNDGLKQWEIERYNRRMGIQTGNLGYKAGSSFAQDR